MAQIVFDSRARLPVNPMITPGGIYYFMHPAEPLQTERPPVLLLHGAGGNYLSWPPQLRRLEGQTVYALDLPGHGQSQGIGRQSIEAYADDVAAFMEALNLPQAVLAGISMGSAIALTLALKYPKKVKALALLGGGAKMRVSASILETAGNPVTFDSTVDRINLNCFSASAQENLVQLSRKHMLKVRPTVLLGDFLACNAFNVADELSKIKAPALIVCGAEDKMMPPKYSEALREGMKKSTLHILEGAGHMVMLETPEEVSVLFDEFLSGLRSRKRKSAARLAENQPEDVRPNS